VFGRLIGANQGIQHPLAENWMYLESAFWMLMRAGYLYDTGQSCGAEANAGKFLAGRAAFYSKAQYRLDTSAQALGPTFVALRQLVRAALQLPV
jgi:alkylation response protein AidB-like acyl-CoA dehydrogenase